VYAENHAPVKEVFGERAVIKPTTGEPIGEQCQILNFDFLQNTHQERNYASIQSNRLLGIQRISYFDISSPAHFDNFVHRELTDMEDVKNFFSILHLWTPGLTLFFYTIWKNISPRSGIQNAKKAYKIWLPLYDVFRNLKKNFELDLMELKKLIINPIYNEI
jgi:hypothetical protein